MKLLIIADDEAFICKLPAQKVDVLISLGDLSNRTIERAIAYYQPDKSFAVRGSHDIDYCEYPEEVTPLHQMVETFRNVTFGGFNGCWRYKPGGSYLYDQQEASSLLDQFPKVNIFVAHSSPAGIHEINQEANRGLYALRDYVVRHQPDLFIHGQQHINAQKMLGKTPILGIYGERLIEVR